MLTQYNNLFKKALLYWGTDAQLNMVAEENSEINFLLAKYRRYGMDHKLSRPKKNQDGSEYIEHISIRNWLKEECADGLIMLSQLALILGAGEVWNEIRKKADRLRDRLYELDHTRKEISCGGCNETFGLYAEINTGLICKFCGEPLFKVGFKWIRIYDDSENIWKSANEPIIEGMDIEGVKIDIPSIIDGSHEQDRNEGDEREHE